MDDLLPQIVEEEKGIPTNLASFKLDLQENEKKAKEELVLPYTLLVNCLKDKTEVIILYLI